jgi:hypothetical protein
MRLWCAGHLHGHEMRDAIQRLLAALDRDGLRSMLEADGALKQIVSRAGLKISLDCDPAAEGFLRLLAHAIDARPPA